MNKDDLSRAVILDVTQSGHVFIRGRGAASMHGLPVYSVDTYEEAEALQVRHCRRVRSGLYRLNDWPEDPDVEELEKVTDLFRATHGNLK